MARVDDTRTITTLSTALTVFSTYPGPRVLAALLTAIVGVRMVLLTRGAGLNLAELGVVVGIMLGLWPVQEWVLHRYVLHLRPRELAGWRLDPEFARRHRAHHRVPNFIPDILLPLPVVLPLIPVVIGLWWWVMPSLSLGLSATAAYVGAALAYEWIHYLTHTGVAPRTRWFRRVRRNHRYHHYKNERYWLGFCLPLVDTVLGTNPDPTTVETSKTARTLGVDEQ